MILITATLFLVSLILCIFVDLRFLAIAMLIIGVIFPMFVAFLYFYHALKPGFAFNILSHRFSLDKEDLSVTIRTSIDPEQKDNKEGKENVKDEERDIIEERFREIRIGYGELGNWEEFGGKAYYPVKGKEGLIILDRSFFYNEEEFVGFIGEVNAHILKKQRELTMFK